MSDETGRAIEGAENAIQAQFRAYTPPTTSGQRYNVQLTVTGETVAKLVSSVQKFTQTLEDGGWSPAYGFAGPGEVRPANGAPPPMPATTQPHAPSASGPVGLASGDGDGGALDCATYAIVARKGVPVCEFWKPRRNFPEIIITGQEYIDQHLGPLGLPTALAIEPYPYPCRVYFKWGKEKPAREDGRPGGRYQDVTRVELIPPA